jgi:hypothetical protein
MRIVPPVRVSHTFTQVLGGPPGAVMPLLCPVREAEWAKGWAPELVVSTSGVVERDCVFTTREAERESTWVVTEHEPTAGRVEMLKVTPGFLVTRLRISLRALPADIDGARTAAEITYTYTALGPEGEEFVRACTGAAYAEFMRAWETELNDYLRRQRQTAPALPGPRRAQ